MAGTKHTGTFGDYYAGGGLTKAQQEANVLYIGKYLTNKGWTLNAIAGLCGNIESECHFNPGTEEIGGSGYGLIQWTPGTIHKEWCENNGYTDHSTMDANLAHIVYEAKNNTSWYVKEDYDLSYSEFTKSSKNAYYLACAFAWNRERSAVVLWGFNRPNTRNNAYTPPHTGRTYCKKSDYDSACEANCRAYGYCYNHKFGATRFKKQQEKNKQDVCNTRGGQADSWYKFLQEKLLGDFDGSIAGDDSAEGATDTSGTVEEEIKVEVKHPSGSTSTFGIYTGTLTKQNKDHFLTSHLPLYLFTAARTKTEGAKYVYSEKTIELIETLILTYRDKINQVTPVYITSSYRPSSVDMHQIGAAVDVKFYDKTGQDFLDCRYLAVAAEELGFSGIAPLHVGVTTNNVAQIQKSAAYTIHLDTRKDYVNAGGQYSNSLWRGYEYDHNGDGWYSSGTITAKTHRDFYGITDNDILAVLGPRYSTIGSTIQPLEPSIGLPQISNIQPVRVGPEFADISMLVLGTDISTLSYQISYNNLDDEDISKEVHLEVKTGEVSFSIADLIPNTDYTLIITATNDGGTFISPALRFITAQDYPDPVKDVIIKSTDKNIETATFKVTIEEPGRWGYWQRIGNNYGYQLFFIEDCQFKSSQDSKVVKTFNVKPSDKAIQHEKSFQVGVSSWVTDDAGKKIFAQPGEDSPVCSNSVYFKDISEVSDRCFLLTNRTFYHLQPYLKDTLGKYKPLKVFKS